MSSENTDNMENKPKKKSLGCFGLLGIALAFLVDMVLFNVDGWAFVIISVGVFIMWALISKLFTQPKSEEVEGSTEREFISVNDMTCVDLVANHALVLLVYYDSKSSGDLFRMLKEVQNACVDDIAIGFYDISDKDNTNGVADNDIRMTPTFILYRNGAESQTEVGPRSAEQLLGMIQGEY